MADEAKWEMEKAQSSKLKAQRRRSADILIFCEQVAGLDPKEKGGDKPRRL